MNRVCLFFLLLLLLLMSMNIGNSQMDTKSLVSLLNFSKTLIKDGEIKFLFYERFPPHPDDVGEEQRRILAFRENEFREASKNSNTETLKKDILQAIEEEKRYGGFRDSEENYQYLEVDLVFQVNPHPLKRGLMLLDGQLSMNSHFEKYPSLTSKRFFNDGNLIVRVNKSYQVLSQILPNQFANDQRIGSVRNRSREHTGQLMGVPTSVPPTHFIDEKRTKIELSESFEQMVYVITHFPFEDDDQVMAKVYVRLNNKLPEVFREKYYYQSESPLADAQGYWLRVAAEYKDFEKVEQLNLTIPKVRVEKEYLNTDGFMRRKSVYTIKEMAFNLGLPSNFFDWDETELTGDDGKRKKIRGGVQKEKTAATHK